MSEALTPEQQDLINRFLNTFCSIENHIRSDLGAESKEPFVRLIDRYADAHRGWATDHSDLRSCAGLRNLLSHGRNDRWGLPAVPVPAVVSRVEEIWKRLQHPVLAIPCFQREVTRIQSTDGLKTVMRIMHEKDYSQFPVYLGDEFRGVLTERGLARFLVGRILDVSRMDFAELPAAEALKHEEERGLYAFAKRDTPVTDVLGMFADSVELEVVLFTENGVKSELPLGIATPWDIVRLPRA